MAASGTVLIVWLSHLTFFYDEWDPLLLRRGLSAHVLLAPHVDHILLGPTVFYKTIQATIGMESLVPYAIVSTASFLLSVAVLWVYLRRRVGEWLALAGVLPILFLGAAHEDLLWPFEISFTASMAGGIGALLALERPVGRGDALACGLLVLSLTFSELALSFVLGAAVVIALARGPWRRAYVVAVPLVLYAAWYAGWGHTGEHHLTFHAIANSFSYVLDGLSAGVASILGFADDPAGGLGWGRPLLVVLVVASFARARLGPPLPGRLWAVLAIMLSFWFLLAVNSGIGREPIASRYQYVAAVLLLLVAAELASGVRLKPPGVATALVVAGFAALSNLAILHVNYRSIADLTSTVRGGLAGLEIGADSADPGLVLNMENSDVNYLDAVHAGPYLSAVDAFGSPAYDQSELARAPEGARVAADKVIAASLRLAVHPTAHLPPAGATPPKLLSSSETLPASRPGCLTVRETGGAPPVLELPPGGALLTAPGGATVALRRFATESFPILAPAFTGSAVLPIPSDRSIRPWELQIAGPGPVTVCGRRAG